MNKIKVSIIIPAWHEVLIIKNTLKALNNLDYQLKRCEIIVIASNDDPTYSIAKNQSMKNFGRFIILKQAKGGKNTALQQGLAKSKGEIIILLDADVIVDKRWLKNLIRQLENGSADCVNGNYFPLIDSWINKYFMMEKIWGRQIKGNQSTHGGGGIALKKELIKNVGVDILLNKDIYVGVDHYFGEQILKAGQSIDFIKEAKTKTYFNTSLKGFIKDQLRWKKGYICLISTKKVFVILLFNLIIVFSLISTIFSHKSLLSLPFFVYFAHSFVKSIVVSLNSSKISFVFYFPVYLMLNLLDRLMTSYIFSIKFTKRIFKIKENKQIHFKGERK